MSKEAYLLTVLLSVLTALTMTVPAQAQSVIYVDDDASSDPGPGDPAISDPLEDGSAGHPFDAIQEGIDAAQPGDEVVIADGVYTGAGNKNLDFGGKDITVRSASGDPSTCVIDCQGAGRGFFFHSGETPDSVVTGLTIRNGYVSDSSPGSWYGGGVYCSGSDPTIANNIITGNSASYYGLGYGGGLYLEDSSPAIANNSITSNSSDYGGGLCLSNSSPTITNNTITGNTAFCYEGGSGGGVYLELSSPTIANNTITSNSAWRGGGLYLSNSSPTIANNTITSNSVYYFGGGMYLYDSSPMIANTIVGFNVSGIYRSGGGTPTLRHNCVFGNTDYDYSGLADPTGTDGNISADPGFADMEYGNVHIQPDSPCVDAGDNAYAYGDFDIDGEPRIQPGGGTVDIGADESDGALWPGGPYAIVRVSPEGDDGQDGSSWTAAKRTVQAGIGAASASGGEVWVQAGTYYERVALRPYAYVYGGFDGSEADREERDWRANATILDGQQQGSVVTAQTGYGAVGAIDGFTITHGGASYGSGVYLWYSSPTIANNTITGNDASSGGGLWVFHSSATIINNTIAGNSAEYHYGGGLYLESSSSTIADNMIAGNSASYGLSLIHISEPTRPY